ncbi:isochorismate synthase [Pseudomonas sp. S9]|uniref:isochorismate synthase n=1 Tax=Pseudomonas sp. S9 TaxID=686578 RepID=UPI0002557199|nr:isochorismate synthase [Pseudomonas sp. S9]
MNALTQVAHGGAPWSEVYTPTYRFYSPMGGVEASGCFKAIETPAGEDGSGVERSVEAAFAEAKAAGLQRPMVVGVIPFDKQQPSSLFVPRHVARLAPLAPPTSVCGMPCGKALHCTEQPDRDGFKQAVCRAVDVLRGGQLSKVVLSRLLQLDFDRAPCAATVFQGLRQQNPEAFHFFMDLPAGGVLIGASPELLLRQNNSSFSTNPLAGTIKRMADPALDAHAAQTLLRSCKDLHEHRFVIDELDRQLRPLCTHLNIAGEPSLLKTARLWHLSTQISGQLVRPLSALSLACRLHPTPALCGFPTAAAKQLIAELEPFDRGVFGGIVGWSDCQGNGEWAVVIRCGIVEQTRVKLFAGAGLVTASCPESEWQETGNKLSTMLSAFGLEREAI